MMAEGGGVNKLSEEQIYECLKDFSVPVKMNEIKSPTKEFIIRVFECFLKDLQLDLASPILRPWAATNHIEDGEIYEEAQLLTLLAICVNKMTAYANLTVTLKDIIDPKPKRTKKILNYLLRFWKYYVEKYNHFIAVEETFENERKKREEVICENESLENKIADKLSLLQNMQPNKEELQRTYDAKGEKNSKLLKESGNLQAEYTKLKTREISLQEQIRATELNIVKAKETLEELSQLILSSPKQELINTEIKNLEKKIKDIEARTKECEAAFKDEVKKLQLLEEYKKDEEKVQNSFNDIKDSYTEISEIVKAMVDAPQINDVEDKLKQLEMDLERKEDWQFQQDQKSAKLLLNKKKQLETLGELLKMNQSEEAKIKNQLEILKNAVQCVQDNMDTESTLVLGVIKSCKEADAKSKDREMQFKSMLKQMSDLFTSDCDEIMENILNVFPYDINHSQKLL